VSSRAWSIRYGLSCAVGDGYLAGFPWSGGYVCSATNQPYSSPMAIRCRIGTDLFSETLNTIRSSDRVHGPA
jgi:hypothetical protein